MCMCLVCSDGVGAPLPNALTLTQISYFYQALISQLYLRLKEIHVCFPFTSAASSPSDLSSSPSSSLEVYVPSVVGRSVRQKGFFFGSLLCDISIPTVHA